MNALPVVAILAFTSTGLNGAVVVVSDSTPAYLDASSTTRILPIASAGAVQSITVGITFEKYDGQTFGVNGGGTPYYDEILLQLTSPLGTTVNLIAANSFNSGSGGFYGTIVFDDSAALAVNYDGNSPHAGTYKPTQPLSTFIGENGLGNWVLTITDTVSADHLGYHSSYLSINQAVPEPTSAALVGLAGLGFACRRRRC